MSDQPEQDRRHFQRIPFPTEGSLELPDGEIEVEVVDLSLKGALLRPSRPIELGEDAAGVLKLALSPEVTIVMAVTVAHQGAGRIGLDCTHIDIESAQHLRRLVELNLGDDALLHRELAALIEAHSPD
jgi:hypothetical protein